MKTIPPAPGVLPLTGHDLALLRDPLPFLSSLSETGDVVEVRIGTHRMYMICSPELTRQVMVDDRTFDKSGPFHKRTREIFGNRLGTCTHREHQRQRRLVQPAFVSARDLEYAKVMTARIADVIGRWWRGEPLDVFAEMQRITGFTVLSAMLAHEDVSADTLAQLLGDMNTVVKGMFWRMFLPSPLDWLPIPSNRRHDQALERLREELCAVIGRYRSGTTDHSDLMSILVHVSDPWAADDGRVRLSDEELVSQVKTFFAAGADSTASTIAWALHRVGSSPRAKAALHQEVAEVVIEGAATFEDLPRLKVTGRIPTEILRLYPPGWLLTRTATRDAQLGDHMVQAGSTVAVSPYPDPPPGGSVPQPESFDPDRWSDDAPRSVAGSMVPFSTGARKCIRDTFALTQSTLALASIAARWTLRDAPGARPRPALSGLPVPKDLASQPTPIWSTASSRCPWRPRLPPGPPLETSWPGLYQRGPDGEHDTLACLAELNDTAGGRRSAQAEADRRLNTALGFLTQAVPQESAPADLIALAHLITDRDN